MPIETIPEDQIPPVPSQPEFASYLPETMDEPEAVAESFPDAPVDELFPSDPEKKERKKEHKKKMSRKMKATMERFQGMFTDGITGWFHQQATVSGHPEWDLEEKDKELIGDSISFVMDAFNIEFDFQTVDLTLSSVWWVLAYPICAFGIVFLNKKGAVDRKVSQDGQN
jgi:hypothetical protein